jgi:hypothetical protein
MYKDKAFDMFLGEEINATLEINYYFKSNKY